MKLGPVYEDDGDLWQDVVSWDDGERLPRRAYQFWYDEDPVMWSDGSCQSMLPEDACRYRFVIKETDQAEDVLDYRIPAIPPTTTSEPTIPLSAVVDLKATITKELTRLYLEGK